MIRIPLYRVETTPADRSRYSGPVPDVVVGWFFRPADPGYRPAVGHPDLAGDHVEAQEEPDVVLLAPDGSRVAEAATGDLALFLPGKTIGLNAEEAMDAARRGRGGLSVALAERLRALIEASRVSQSEVAKRAGITRQSLGQILTGRRPNPGFATIERILAVIGKGLGDLEESDGIPSVNR